ncbi:MAG: hypothetical protein ACRDSH_00435 [Pseudonocardiaceae bacterium]
MAADGKAGDYLMADQSDVETSLVGLVMSALYPSGIDAPSIVGTDCRIYRGWPIGAALDNDLRSGLVNVTVFAGRRPGRVTTRYSDEWVGVPGTPGLTVQVSGISVTFGGSAEADQVAGIIVDGRSYVYRTKSADTAASVAANLAVLARADRIVQLAGTTLKIPGVGDLTARVVKDAPASKEVRRQAQTFRITCWCPSPASRDSAAAAIDQLLAGVTFINLPDGTQGRLIYFGTSVFDQSQDTLLYRRDLLYTVEYATILAEKQPAMLFGDLQLNDATFIA